MSEDFLLTVPTRNYSPDHLNSYNDLRSCGLASFSIKNNIQNCMKCPLSEYNKPLELNVGHKPLMIIGEKPSDVMFEEESGMFLSSVLKDAVFNFSDIYFTSAVKCQESGDFKACNSHLIGEIISVFPTCILALGYNAGSSIVENIESPGYHTTIATGQDILVTYSIHDVLNNQLNVNQFKSHIELMKNQLYYRLNEKERYRFYA